MRLISTRKSVQVANRRCLILDVYDTDFFSEVFGHVVRKEMTCLPASVQDSDPV